MKIIRKPIEVIAYFPLNKKEPQPLRFRITNDDDEANTTVVRIRDIVGVKREKKASIESIQYICQAIINKQLRIFELKYFILDHTWMLFKI